MGTAKALNSARKNKDDEYYTREVDIEKEVLNYTEHLKDKVIYCNCDNYNVSSFYFFFKKNFNKLQLKKLISTNYANDYNEKAYKAEYDGINEIISTLNGNGDYKSDECKDILYNEADIVITNPPFSLFREFMLFIIESGKKYLILANQNAAKYKEIFPYIVDNKMHLGTRKMGWNMWFYRPIGSSYEKILDGKPSKHMSTIWYTNLENNNYVKPLVLNKTYEDNKDLYCKFDTYDALDVEKVQNIPNDYEGVIGVPLSYLSYYCPKQFKIIGMLNGGAKGVPLDKGKAIVNGKEKYTRILIKKV